MAHPFCSTPIETAPMLGVFGPLASRVGALARHQPTLAIQLMQAPPRAIHAIAAYLHHIPQDADTWEVAAAILTAWHPRELLRHAFPHADARLYRVLNRASLPAWSLQDYTALDNVLRSDISDLLIEKEHLEPQFVQNALAILQSGSVVRRARYTLRHSTRRKHLQTTVEALEALGLLRDLANLPDRATGRTVARRIIADLGRAEAPDIAFPIPGGWTLVRTAADLWRHGGRMSVCVKPGRWGSSSYVLSMLMGRSVFLHHHEKDLLAQFRQMPAGRWSLSQCAAPRNEHPPQDILQNLLTEVQEGGIVLLPTDFDSALDAVLDMLNTKLGNTYHDGGDEEDLHGLAA